MLGLWVKQTNKQRTSASKYVSMCAESAAENIPNLSSDCIFQIGKKYVDIFCPLFQRFWDNKTSDQLLKQ